MTSSWGLICVTDIITVTLPFKWRQVGRGLIDFPLVMAVQKQIFRDGNLVVTIPQWRCSSGAKPAAGTLLHNGDVIMGTVASQITSLSIVYSTVRSDADQRKHQSSALLVFVRWIHRWPVNSPHKWPVTRKMFPFDDVIMDSKIDTSFFLCGCCWIRCSW